MVVQAKLYTDAAYRPVAGLCGGAAILWDMEDKIIEAYAWPIPATGNTNNTAEYQALEFGLVNALLHGIKNLDVYMDSKLIISQMNGEYKVKAFSLMEWYDACSKMVENFEKITFTHVYRSENQLADRLAGKAAATGKTFLYSKDPLILEDL